eukprot:1158920-Pelagomonas_calceolata.AAC.8
MQARVWEVNGFRTLPLRRRNLMEGQHGQQQQQQTQQEQQQTQQTGIFQRELLGTQQQHRQPVGSQREEPPQSAQQQQTNQQQQQHKDGQVAHRSERSPSLSDLPPKFTLFHEPATLGLRFTNALARFVQVLALPVPWQDLPEFTPPRLGKRIFLFALRA